jgi:Flp pilus assembly protein TadD
VSNDRIASLERMLERNPNDSRIRFGLALEYLNSGDTESGVRELRAYLDASDDEGNAWGRLGAILKDARKDDEAREAYRHGIEAANRHGHPTMAEEFEEILDRWNL